MLDTTKRPMALSEIYEKISRTVDSMKDEIVKTLTQLISIPAISPDYGGEGELDKANALLEIIKNWGFDEVRRIDAPDKRAKGGVRPNILAIYRGTDPNAGKLWIVAHLDVVPPGDLSAWTVTEPFKPRIVNDRVYGRGSEDNGQSLVASLYAVKALMELGIRPRKTVMLAFVSDEETGSEYGIKYLMRNNPELFDTRDSALVPDAGNSDGSFIEVAEKSILWVRFRVIGKQAHASTPNKGLNAHEVAIALAYLLKNTLTTKYDMRDPLYDPPESTFVITMVSNPSTSPNIMPGTHEFVIDCRVLPQYNLDDILRDMDTVANLVKAIYGRVIDGEQLPRIEREIIQRLDAPKPTSTRLGNRKNPNQGTEGNKGNRTKDRRHRRRNIRSLLQGNGHTSRSLVNNRRGSTPTKRVLENTKPNKRHKNNSRTSRYAMNFI